MRRLLTAAILALVALHAGTFHPAKPGEQVVANEYLVKFAPGASALPIIGSLVPGSTTVALPALNIHKVIFPAGTSTADATRLAANPFVIYVEPNHVRKIALSAPNDPAMVSQQYALANIQASQAWAIIPNGYLTSATANTSRVKVAVIDTGIDCTHPDFTNAGGSSTDSALGGQLLFSLSHAYETTTVAQAKCAWQDDHGHGTHVAGIIAAATNNNIGVASLGYALQVVGYKGLDSTGAGDDATLGTAIMDAANAGVHLVSASWGGAGYSRALQDAINYAWQRNTLLIAAAGNDGKNELFFPAGAAHALGVAATDSANNVAGFSNSGNAVGIAAPGVSIYSTLPTYTNAFGVTNYGTLSGTSMATPHVSALAGLLAMMTPNASVAAIVQRIQQTAVSNNINGGWNPTKGYGIINAYNAVSATPRTATTGALTGQVTDVNGNLVGSASLTVNGQQVTADANGLYRFAAVPAGTYAVAATAAGFSTQNLSTTVVAGADTVLPVVMGLSYGKFTGIVKDAGVPVAGAIVQAITPNASGTVIQATAVSDLNGTYTLWVPAGTYDVTASALSANSGTVGSQAVVAGGSTAVNPTIAHFGIIGGTVTNGSGQPMAGVQLFISGGGTSFGAVSDSSGNYKTVGLPAATYTIDASFPGTSDQIINNINVSVDATATVNIKFGAVTAPTVQFLTTDTATQGNWKAKYGVDGYTVVGDSALNPSYVTPSSSGSAYVWAASTTDARALQKAASATDRIAATWYSSTNFVIDLPFTDQVSHQVAIYCTDWDNFGPRMEKIEVLDTNNNVLDTHTLSSFSAGEYLVWNVTGHVQIRATTLQGNAVIEGIFFGGPFSAAGVPTVQFLTTDTATQGNWKSKYGVDGYTVVGDSFLNPSYVTPSSTGSTYVWAPSTTDVRALQKAASAADRIAATWFSNTNFVIDLPFTDQVPHQVAIYCTDWDNFGPRMEKIEVLDTNNNVLDTHTLSSFSAGEYLVWNITGHVQIRATTLQGNAVIEGIFFGGPFSAVAGPVVQFLTTDTATQGNWKAKYGVDGYTVVGDSVLNPSYVTPSSSGSAYVWDASTTDARALQKAASATDRIAATWYSSTNFVIDLPFKDQVSHQVAIYCTDWDNFGPRMEKIEVLDTNNNVLDTHTLSSFSAGEYLVWNITGHVQIRATTLQGNAVIEGLFFH